jgi:ABC-2 type transport system permease protein
VRNVALVFAHTLRQILSRRRSIVLVLVALMPAALGIVARHFAAPYPKTPFLTTVPILFTSFLLQILSLFYGASVVRDTIEDRTAMFMLTTPTSRTSFLLGVYAALVVNLLLILELAIATTFLTWGAGVPGEFPGGVLFGPECRSLMGVVAIGVLIYAAMFMLLGVWTRHSAVLGVVYFMVFEVFLGLVPGPARRLAISAHLDALLDERFETRRVLSAEMFHRPASYEITPTLASVTLTIWFVVFMTALLWRGRRHDFMDLSEPGK